MKLLGFVLFSIISVNANSDDVFVEGHTKLDGTYIQPRIESSSDERKNYSDDPQEQQTEMYTRENESAESINWLDYDVDNDLPEKSKF